MSDPAHLKHTSKFLSLVLRHDPGSIGLTLDAGGWADIDALIAAADLPLDRDLLTEVVRNSDKQRFSLSEDGQRIRANQGHSIPVDLGLEPVQPPDLLFHGTAVTTLDAIMRDGLRPMSRQHVHLSPDHETAVRVGQRHGRPVVFGVDAKKMHQTGHVFWRSVNGVWLTKAVPPEFLSKSAG